MRWARVALRAMCLSLDSADGWREQVAPHRTVGTNADGREIPMLIRILALVAVMLVVVGARLARSRRHMQIEDGRMEEALERFEGEGGRVA